MGFFKRWLRPLFFLSVVSAMSVAILYYLKERNYSKSFERKYAHRQQLAPAKTVTVIPKRTDDAIRPMAPTPTPEASPQLHSRLKVALQELAPELRKCTERREEILADKDLIDSSYNFYRSLDTALSLYDGLFKEVLLPEGALHVKVLIEDILKSEESFNVKEIGTALAQTDYCLREGAKAYSFIDTLFESLKTQEWPLDKKLDLKRVTLDKVRQVLGAGSFASATQLAVSMSLFEKLSEYGLLSLSFPDELTVLKEKIIESERLEREFMNNDRGASYQRELLLQQIEGSKYLQSEMMEIVRRELERFGE